MTLRSFIHTILLIPCLTVLAVLGACSKTPESAPSVAIHTTTTTTLGSQVDDTVGHLQHQESAARRSNDQQL